ncbi:MAG: 3-methyl-2-oxobutanoate hydroxymethyltransferase [Candidatus Omnitrophica bacterium]|nr:3-methyl-2-oxobutanoate hydroxymethyltransferase [Candidatus Omnitrophota bacterium]
METKKIKVEDIIALKGIRKLTMLTAYDYPLASLIDQSGVDMILVGDSLANVVLGLDSTTEVGMSEMLHHAKAVTRGVKRAFVIGDMPYESYQVNPQESAVNARRFIKEAACDAVKLEWFDSCLEATRAIIESGIPTMGHIGLTPQTAAKSGGFKVRGKDAEAASRLIEEAVALQEAGCFSIVLECVPDKISEIITGKLKIPVIGIGAGVGCDGQVLVTYDLLGLYPRHTPKFVKKYTDLTARIQEALAKYKQEVESGIFPDAAHSFTIKQEELDKIKLT